ncbi:MAG: DUF368 domain-containing protein [Candidatus Thermoplasmatota archaeon]|nr:DUF368 domain-containing protein [Euryarchaeota archaeon]MBU4032210.1 DUF368 domain-containing protein [Candidatus Thermoplasmatota archaeon]MBU4071808.1 DUF368 domain-containing protein [Candidatus Thermoplasmatota archaeon]MBU4143955.1 DUF368 domain-containing protein [Candidatus Thermoplasmatota archaeon]MBU4592562.1 DUF368 domain-containing protein [Candidatus Thermoplasmatota archaeon]
MKFKQSFKLFLKGLAVGVADLVPGVSGGTVALILGIYERLIRAIRNISFRLVRNTLKKEGPKSQRLDLEFLVPLALGVAVSFVALSYVMMYFLGELASPTFTFFFVVILGSSLVLFKSEKLASAKNVAIAAMGFLLAFYLVGLNQTNLGHELPILFITGILVIVAMILPGTSGALLLLLMNQYEYFFDALHEFRIVELLAFGAGAAIGLLAFSHALNAVLEKYRAQTVAFLIGLTLGALRLCYSNITMDSNTIFPVFIAALVGVFIIFMLEARNMMPGRCRKALKTE